MDKKIIITREPIDDYENKYSVEVEWLELDDRMDVWFVMVGALRAHLDDLRKIMKQNWVAKEDKEIYNAHIKEVVNILID